MIVGQTGGFISVRLPPATGITGPTEDTAAVEIKDIWRKKGSENNKRPRFPFE